MKFMINKQTAQGNLVFEADNVTPVYEDTPRTQTIINYEAPIDNDAWKKSFYNR